MEILPRLAIKEQEKMAIKTKLVTWTFFCLLCNVMTSVKIKGSVHSAIKWTDVKLQRK